MGQEKTVRAGPGQVCTFAVLPLATTKYLCGAPGSQRLPAGAQAAGSGQSRSQPQQAQASESTSRGTGGKRGRGFALHSCPLVPVAIVSRERYEPSTCQT